LSFSGSLATAAVHFITQTLTATLSFTGSQTRSVVRTLTAVLSFTGSLARRAGHVIIASLSFTGVDTELIRNKQNANLTFTGTQTRWIVKGAMAATLSFTGSLASATFHFFTKALTATLSFTGNMTAFRLIVRILTATVGFTTTYVKKAKPVLSSTLSFTGNTLNRIAHKFTAVLSLTGLMTMIPHVISALSNLRIRIFGRETDETIAGMEGVTIASGKRPSGIADGEEPGT
jgi:hypothetical protein